jgi:hypothetical protein
LKRAIRLLALAIALVLSASGASSTELKLSASVRADLAAGPAERQTATPAEPLAYLIVTESAEAAARIAAALRPVVATLDYRSGRILSFSATQIGGALRSIPMGNGVVTVDRMPLIELGKVGRTTTVPFSKNAQLAHNVPRLAATYAVNGKGIGVGVFDQGSVLASHVEFDDRVELRDPDREIDEHATQVAGNIAAQGDPVRGGNSDAQGIAPGSRIYSFVWKDDIQKLRKIGESEPSIYVTNHSYSATRGWSYVRREALWGWYGDPRISATEDYWFGKYNARSVAIDAVVSDYPHLSIFVAAGNNRDPKGYPKTRDPDWNGLHWLPVLRRSVNGPMRPPDNQHDGGYDTLEGFAVAKNVITIGAMEDVPKGKQLEPATVLVTAFSNWGPADDGRIKPDLVANGSDLRTPTVELWGDRYNKRAYANKDGTSMAAPTGAGVAALLTELSIARRGKPLGADEMKAALIATAISPQRGPSYRTGWGAIDALAAGKIVAGDAGGVFTRIGEANSIEIKLTRTSGSMNVTAAWIDLPAAGNSGGLNDRTPALVLDFDLELIDPAGKSHFPWSLDPERPSAAATNNAPNRRDNVERIDIDDGEAANGIWKVKITTPANAVGHQIAVAVQGLTILE